MRQSKSTALFSLVPTLSFRRRFITLDAYSFRSILKQAGINVTVPSGDHSHPYIRLARDATLFFTYLDFQKARLRKCTTAFLHYPTLTEPDSDSDDDAGGADPDLDNGDAEDDSGSVTDGDANDIGNPAGGSDGAHNTPSEGEIDDGDQDKGSFTDETTHQDVGSDTQLTEIDSSDEEDDDDPASLVFSNRVRTDGLQLEFIYGKRAPQIELPDLEMDDLHGEPRERMQLYGHSSNSTNGWHGRYMRFSNNEWLSLSGRHGRSCIRKRWLKDSGMEEILTRIPPAKTSHPDRFIQRTIYVFQHLDDITEHFADDYTLHRFLDYCGDKKMCAEVVNHFVHGGNKYKHQKEDYDSRKLPVIAYGGALFAQTRRGKKSTRSGKVYKALKIAEKQGLLLVTKTNEYNTSKVCPMCDEKDLEHKTVGDPFLRGASMSLWSVLQCQHCKINWDRDKLAAWN
ncbi:hypothetical protein DM01DRAFT_1338899, partial [Hesseltinella vesiculosa]